MQANEEEKHIFSETQLHIKDKNQFKFMVDIGPSKTGENKENIESEIPKEHTTQRYLSSTYIEKSPQPKDYNIDLLRQIKTQILAEDSEQQETDTTSLTKHTPHVTSDMKEVGNEGVITEDTVKENENVPDMKDNNISFVDDDVLSSEDAKPVVLPIDFQTEKPDEKNIDEPGEKDVVLEVSLEKLNDDFIDGGPEIKLQPKSLKDTSDKDINAVVMSDTEQPLDVRKPIETAKSSVEERQPLEKEQGKEILPRLKLVSRYSTRGVALIHSAEQRKVIEDSPNSGNSSFSNLVKPAADSKPPGKGDSDVSRAQMINASVAGEVFPTSRAVLDESVPMEKEVYKFNDAITTGDKRWRKRTTF